MRWTRLEPLASPLLIAAVAVLVVNDWVLKPAFHNALTGKLSDVAGVAAFALFWAALFPRRRFHAFLMTAVAFTVWKSPASQPVIDAWKDRKSTRLNSSHLAISYAVFRLEKKTAGRC